MQRCRRGLRVKRLEWRMSPLKIYIDEEPTLSKFDPLPDLENCRGRLLATLATFCG
jgi:hypothetical protein